MSSYAARSAAAHNSAQYENNDHNNYYGGGGVPSGVTTYGHLVSDASTLGDPSVVVGGGPANHAPSLPVPVYASAPSAGVDRHLAPEVQARLLDDCVRRVEEQAYLCRQAMDHDDLGVALDHAAHMLSELGPGSHQSGGVGGPGRHRGDDGGGAYGSARLTPRSYYALQTRVAEEMPALEEYLDEVTERRPEVDLKALMAFAPRVVPRLYLSMSADGAALRASRRARTDVMREAMDAVKSVQSPLRGLFLRDWLLRATRSSPAATAADDAVGMRDLLLRNFVEMNRLWVRIQHLPGPGGPSSKPDKRERRRREKERNELRSLVGTNLVRLSELSDTIPPKDYAEHVLPPILNEIADCNDALAQAYLMDCVIQVFPDEYHMVTMKQFLDVCPRLKEKVNLRTILQSLMERLTKYADAPPDDDDRPADGDDDAPPKPRITIPLDTFALLSECVERVARARIKQQTDRVAGAASGKKTAPPNHSEIVHLFTQLLNFSLRCYPRETSHISRCLGTCAETLNVFAACGKAMDDKALADLETLLTIPLERSADVFDVLDLQDLPTLAAFLPAPRRRAVAVGLAAAARRSAHRSWDAERVHALLTASRPLWRDDDGNDNDGDPDETRRRATLVASLVHRFDHEDTDARYKTLNLCRRHLLDGGSDEHKRVVVPTLVFATLTLLRRVFDLECPEEPAVVLEEEEKPLVVAAVEGATEEKKEDGAADDVETAEKAEDTKEENENKESMESVGDNDAEGKKDDEIAEEKDEQEASESPENEESENDTSSSERNLTVSEAREKYEPDTKDEKDDDATKEEKDEVVAETVSKKENADDANDPVVATTEEEDDVVVVEAPTEPPPPVPSVPPPPVPPPPPAPVFDKLVNCRKIFLFLQKLVHSLTPLDPESSFRLHLQLAAEASNLAERSRSRRASTTDHAAVAYEFFVRACDVYETSVAVESAAQYRAVTSLCGAVARAHLDPPDRDALSSRTAQFAARLLRRPDQCRSVATVSCLFDASEDRPEGEPKRVLECLQRALRVADACASASDANARLFVDVLDRYVYWLERGSPTVTPKFVSGLVALVHEHLSSAAATDDVAEAKAHFRQTLRHIMKKRDEGGSFADVVC